MNASGSDMNTLLEACFEGRVGPASQLLNEVNFCKQQVTTPACVTTNRRNLLDSGETYYDINDALHVACCGKNLEILDLLLHHGADPNKSTMGSTFQFAYEFKKLSKCLPSYFLTAERFQGQALHFAAYANNTSIIEMLLDHDADINGTDCVGATPLLIAVKTGSIEVSKLLLERGASQICKDDGTTPLHAALGSGNCEISAITSALSNVENVSTRSLLVEMLLEHGGNPNCTNKRGQTPLHRAFADVAVIKILLKNGVDCHASDSNGRTALLNASWCIHEENHSIQTEAVKILLKHGADPNVADSYKHLPLLYACRSANPDVVKLLLDFGANANVFDIRGNPALHLALRIEEDVLEKQPTMSATQLAAKREVIHDIVKELLEHGADPSMPEQTWGKTALHIACSKGQLSIARELLIFAADPNIRDSDGNTPLHLLRDGVTRNSMSHEIAAVLLQYGAQADITNHSGDTLLHYACRSFNRSLIDTLLDGQAEPNVQDRLGNTSIMLLLKRIGRYHKTMSESEYNCAKMTIEALLDRGANPNVSNNTGQTPMMLMCLHCDCDTIKVLLKHEGLPQHRLCKCDSDFLVFYKRVLNHRPWVNGYHQLPPLDVGNPEQTAMCFIDNGAKITPDVISYACRAGHFAALKYMVSQDVDLNIPDSCGVYPLFYACSSPNANLSIVRFLLDSGADSNVCNPDGYLLPLSCDSSNFDVAKVLLQYNANPNLYCENTGSPLHVVLKYRTPNERLSYDSQLEIINALLEHGAEPNVVISKVSALQLACKNSCAIIVENLLNHGGDVHQKSDGNKSLLHSAVFHLERDSVVEREIIALLLKHGLDVDTADDFCNTALHYACDARQFATVYFMLERGASTRVANHVGDTPLHLLLGCWLDASQTAHQEQQGRVSDNLSDVANFVRALIQHGADPYQANKKMETPMYLAANMGSIPILQALLSACDGKVTFSAEQGKSPLIGAALAGHDEVIEYLTTLPGCCHKDSIKSFQLLSTTKWNAKTKGCQYLKRALELQSADTETVQSSMLAHESPETRSHCHTLQELHVLEASGSEEDFWHEALWIQEKLLAPMNPDLQLTLMENICQQYQQEENYVKSIPLWGKVIEIHSHHIESLKHESTSFDVLERCSKIVRPVELLAAEVTANIRQGVLDDALMNNIRQVIGLLVDVVQKLGRHAVACMEGDCSKMSLSQETKLRLIQKRIQAVACSYDTLWLLFALALDEKNFTACNYMHTKHLVATLNKATRGTGVRAFLLHGLCASTHIRDLTSASQSISSRSFRPKDLIGDHMNIRFTRLLSLMLECGYDVALKDTEGNTPLHYAVDQVPLEETAVSMRQYAVVKLLLEYGAHADSCNEAGLSPYIICQSRGDGHIRARIKSAVCQAHMLSLMCTTARVIKRSKLPYEQLLPNALVSFVALH
ncbi:PREDICTED: serine/threonine-protein phosphatase 6 regulatory ankyrin repeat subunit B-like [Priapulus caudatus]|uniref:Serine/threonine-protein phosphatase 6 regulatory ankyrin repeat subunit B-like n=1 Tax=Priapulus caudatus TaxID=37621 RepID=A0ABM1FC26_PRICU|nr:PREDICTED: serine/threonine-protein phosphatase 6 regulatory ankyrin repeat subunit B-like [Priapulus caudatus]